MKLKDGDTIVFAGDSITDCGRDRSGIGVWNFGDGYVNIFNSLMLVEHSEILVNLINMGIGGDRSIDLAARWERDIMNHKPDWVAVLIGINDVWFQFHSPASRHQIEIEEFEDTYRVMIERALPEVKGMALMSPFHLEPNRDDPMREMMDAYGATVAKLAKEYDTLFIDLQADFDDFMRVRPSQMLAWDRIHPNHAGNLIIAKSLMRTLTK